MRRIHLYKVIIVEDEPIIRKGLVYKVNWPQNNCIVVGSASNGDEGIKIINELKPDIVITDVRMPFTDGLVMLSEAKKNHTFEAIIISGFNEFDYAKQAISLGVSNYLLKPVDINELEAIIAQLILKIKEKKDNKNLERQFSIYKEVLDLDIHFNYGLAYIKDVIEFISENYNKEITLQDISDELHVSSVFLNNRFKKETNYSISEFLTRYRILKALQILQTEKIYVYEVAEKVGFSEYKYFSQVFKNYIGMSPRQFLSEED